MKAETKSAYRECCLASKRLQLGMESVVPDTQEDVGRILSAHPQLFLKSKELTAHGVSVGGEARAVLLTVDEAGTGLSAVSMSKAFTLNFECEEAPGEALAQVALCVLGAEPRLINPRKLALTLELEGKLSLYAPEEQRVSVVPEGAPEGVELLYETVEALSVDSVTEKSFVLTDQLSFPAGQPQPERLLDLSAIFRVVDTQLLGERLLLKGEARLEALYLPHGDGLLEQASFTLPFSQLVELGVEHLDACRAHFELVSSYGSLTESMNGETLLDAELHVLLQLRAEQKQELRLLKDAYSTRCPLSYRKAERELPLFPEETRLRLSGETPLELGEELLRVLPRPGRWQLSAEASELRLPVDLLCRDAEGRLSCARRTLTLSGPGGDSLRCPEGELTRLEHDADTLRAEAELRALRCPTRTVSELEALELDETQPYDLSSLPAVTAVRVKDENLWELAKHFHASEAAIRRLNALDSEPAEGQMILIERE